MYGEITYLLAYKSVSQRDQAGRAGTAIFFPWKCDCLLVMHRKTNAPCIHGVYMLKMWERARILKRTADENEIVPCTNSIRFWLNDGGQLVRLTPVRSYLLFPCQHLVWGAWNCFFKYSNYVGRHDPYVSECARIF